MVDCVPFEPDIKVLKQLEDEEGIWFGREKTEVVLSANPEVASYFKQRRLLPAQQLIKENTDGSLVISIQISHHRQLLPLVRYWIPCIKVLSPIHVQEILEFELRDYLDNLLIKER